MARYYIPSLMDTVHVAAMGRDLTDLYMNCLLAELGGDEEFTEGIAGEMGAATLFRRLTLYGARVTVPVAITLCMVSRGIPGNLMMYAFAMARLCSVKKLDRVDMTALSAEFSIGFPTNLGLRECWEAQKGWNWKQNVDNMLDHPEMIAHDINEEDKQEWCKWLTKLPT